MPHRLNNSRISASHVRSCPLPQSHLPIESSMGDLVSPRFIGQRVYHFCREDVLQSSEVQQAAWRSEVDGRIVEMDVGLNDFLHEFVPSRELPPEFSGENTFAVPQGTVEPLMYEPLCEGLTKLVADFPSSKQLHFHNNAHEEIKFPFELCASQHHVTKPDVIASLPGQRFEGKFPDRWRNISTVFEVKPTEEEDPMCYRTKENDETLVQLSKSARNILVTQSRLFVFVVGVYGPIARIFRFDHAGAVCTRAFDYAEDGGRFLHDFLWRFVHPVYDGCDVVGADPTVMLVSSGQRVRLAEKIKATGVELGDENEASKAFRWVKTEGGGGVKKYLIYKLIFINPRLFSRATTVWEALELDGNERPTGKKVIVKDSWRQLARYSEARHYEDIRDYLDEAAIADTWYGLPEYESGMDLGREEILHPDAYATTSPIGHLTFSAYHQVQGLHSYYERSHMRLVLKTVGTPLSEFLETKEMVQALRDAIEGHRKMFEAGILHRDVSEGNIMIARDRNFKGFIQDLDFGFHWKNFLRAHGWQDTVASWEKFVKTEVGIPVPRDPADDNAIDNTQPRQRPRQPRKPPLPIINRKGEEEWFVEAILDERQVMVNGKSQKEYRVRWEGYEEDTWQPAADVAHCKALDDYMRDRSRTQLFVRVDQDQDQDDDVDGDGDSQGEDGRGTGAFSRCTSGAEAEALECKQRTGTLYFMALEVLIGQGKITHEVRHDLESFYWLLIWIVLRHTAHNNPLMQTACGELFDRDTDNHCAEGKSFWLSRSDLRVKGNAPLTSLIGEFTVLCNRSQKITERHGQVMVPLTYDIVLEVFDKALGRPDWPSGDKAIPWVLPSNNVHPVREARARSTILSSQRDRDARRGIFNFDSGVEKTRAAPPPRSASRPLRSASRPLRPASRPQRPAPCEGEYRRATDGTIGRPLTGPFAGIVPPRIPATPRRPATFGGDDAARMPPPSYPNRRRRMHVPTSPPSPTPVGHPPMAALETRLRFASLVQSLREGASSQPEAGPSRPRSVVQPTRPGTESGGSGSSRSSRKRSRQERGQDGEYARAESSKRTRTDSASGSEGTHPSSGFAS